MGPRTGEDGRQTDESGRRQSHTWISKSEEDDHVQETEAFSGFAVPDVEAAKQF